MMRKKQEEALFINHCMTASFFPAGATWKATRLTNSVFKIEEQNRFPMQMPV
jgi:hypothetical protein